MLLSCIRNEHPRPSTPAGTQVPISKPGIAVGARTAVLPPATRGIFSRLSPSQVPLHLKERLQVTPEQQSAGPVPGLAKQVNGAKAGCEWAGVEESSMCRKPAGGTVDSHLVGAGPETRIPEPVACWGGCPRNLGGEW